MSSSMHFSNSERTPVLLQALLFTIVLFFMRYYGEEIIIAQIVPTVLFFFACSILAVLMHEFGHKYIANKIAYSATITTSNTGLTASLIVNLLTFSRIPLLIGNPVEMDVDTRKRVGKERQYDNARQYAYIAFGGTIGSTIAIALFTTLAQISGNALFMDVALVAGIHAISSLIPWELLSVLTLRFRNDLSEMTPGDGLLIMRLHVLAWIFAISYITAFTFMSTLGLGSFLWALAVGALITGAFAFVLE